LLNREFNNQSSCVYTIQQDFKPVIKPAVKPVGRDNLKTSTKYLGKYLF